MPVDDDTVRHTAALARLHIDDADLPGLVRDMSAILDYVAQIASAAVDTEPSGNPEDTRRADTHTSRQTDALLAAAPVSEAGHFVMPPAMGTPEDDA